MSRTDGASSPLPPFEVLVSTHGATVLRVCRVLVGAGDADDLWQETFLAALRAYPTAAEVLNWQAWLVTIARNKAVDHHRKTLRLPIPASGSGVSDESDGIFSARARIGEAGQGGGDGVVRSVEARGEAAIVWAALGKLPPAQREAVVFHHLAGLRYAEVGRLLGKSPEAARRAASEGMKSLRRELAHVERDFGHD
ncbi:RNA polymerase sigma factor [Arthrobacter sp. LAPM80]|uniref:RNA polymerase sigma factor n=1 Tax=Arthrobacter sp. LAPM80 TaxID=3141788 RepID=UPI00398A890C